MNQRLYSWWPLSAKWLTAYQTLLVISAMSLTWFDNIWSPKFFGMLNSSLKQLSLLRGVTSTTWVPIIQKKDGWISQQRLNSQGFRGHRPAAIWPVGQTPHGGFSKLRHSQINQLDFGPHPKGTFWPTSRKKMLPNHPSHWPVLVKYTNHFFGSPVWRNPHMATTTGQPTLLRARKTAPRSTTSPTCAWVLASSESGSKPGAGDLIGACGWVLR